VETVVRGTAVERGIKAGTLIHAVRVALTGRTASPGLFELMALLGRDETIARLKALLTFLASRN
jgi:glutamyl-tRNA synthetase